MPSPFPGMNPYLEGPPEWEDFHNSLIVAIRDVLAGPLMPRYVVRVQDNVYIRTPDEPRTRIGKPDLTIKTPWPVGTGAGLAVLDAPVQTIIDAEIEEEFRIPYLAILDAADSSVVTILEVLSPSNKALGHDRHTYINKRKRILNSPANLVEIDLLRGGPRMPAKVIPQCDYLLTISRPESRPSAGQWPIGLRDSLPTFRMPLRPGDTEPYVDLQTLLHRIYDIAGYAMTIYQTPPVPPLKPEDAAWAESLLGQAAT